MRTKNTSRPPPRSGVKVSESRAGDAPTQKSCIVMHKVHHRVGEGGSRGRGAEKEDEEEEEEEKEGRKISRLRHRLSVVPFIGGGEGGGGGESEGGS